MIKDRSAFYVLVITQTLSMIGSHITSVGMGIWVFQSTGNTTPLLLTAFFNELPGMLAGSLAGVWVDRWDRRKVMVIADCGQALGSLLLVISLASGQFQLWHLYLVALIQGSFVIFQSPSQDAVTTLLIPDDHRDRANAIRQMAFPFAGVIAPALAGVLFVTVGVTGIILVDMVSFLVAVGALFFLHIPRPPASAEGQAAQGHWLRESLAGFRYIAARPALLSLTLYMTLTYFLLNGPTALNLPYLILKTGSEQLAGSLVGLGSLGAFIGASLIAARGRTQRRVVLLLCWMLFNGLMFLVYGTANSAWLLGAALLLLYIPLPIGGILYTSLLQSKTPPDMQGRIFATYAQLGYLGSTTSFLLTGWLVDNFIEPAVGGPGWGIFAPLVGSQPGSGMGLVEVVTGLLMLAATLALLASPAVRRLETDLPDYTAEELEPVPAEAGAD